MYLCRILSPVYEAGVAGVCVGMAVRTQAVGSNVLQLDASEVYCQLVLIWKPPTLEGSSVSAPNSNVPVGSWPMKPS
jgi:hypothetical protein